MQILLSSAKIIKSSLNELPRYEPLFQNVANMIAMEMAQKSTNELEKILECNYKIASENWLRFQNFFIANKTPAIMAYNGQAYKHLKAYNLSSEELEFAQKHLWITSFLYGLLRPLDSIVPYRMEQNISLDATNSIPMNRFWRNKLSEILSNSLNEDDGIIIHLTTLEYEHLFNWNQIKKEFNVIQPLFYIRYKGELKMPPVWAKTCRGAMTRYIIKNHINKVEDLKAFSYEGFEYNPNIGDIHFPHFIREE